MSTIEYQAAIRSRITFFYVVVVAVFLILLSGLAYRQIFSGGGFLERERIQNQRRIAIPGPRGEVFDREGRVLVANRPRFSAVLYFSDARLRREVREAELKLMRDIREGKIERPPGKISDNARASVVERYLQECSRIIQRDVPLDRRAMEKHFAQQPLLPFTLINDLAPTEFGRLVEQLSTSSPIQLLPSTARHYPYGSAAAHTLGFVGSTTDIPTDGLEGSDLTTFFARGIFGREGLERYFESTLQGQTGSEIWIVDPAGFQVNMVKNQLPVAGKPVYTSLDIDMQLAGEEGFGDQEGALVALDIHTGEVLTMISKPDYDLNQTSPYIPTTLWDSLREKEALYNRATQGTYPPGSTFKIITAMAALRAGAITPDTVFNCPGYLMVGNRRFPCDRPPPGHGDMKLADALRVSCNVYFYQAGIAAGPDLLAAEARRFGLDQPTGIDLPGEAKTMMVPDPAWKRASGRGGWVPGDTANTAIGQGALNVSPLQMACFVASFARNETSTKPVILRRDPSGTYSFGPNRSVGLTSSDRAAIIDGMDQCVQNGGTGKRAAIPGIRIAGKTGTAQKDTPRGKIDIGWFVCFAPIENPEIAIACVIVGDTPDENTHGGFVAAPIVRKVLEVYFKKHPVTGALIPSVAQR